MIFTVVIYRISYADSKEIREIIPISTGRTGRTGITRKKEDEMPPESGLIKADNFRKNR